MLISGTVASRVQGMCKAMCPDSEIRFRCSNGMIHPLEKCEIGRSNRKFVKEYARPAAGRDHLHPECLRPPDILIETVRYLMEVYEEEKNIRFACVYAFMCDRLRAVRQDMILQVVLPVDTVRILQEMIPFYFESDYLCRTKGCSSYDWKLHLTSLEECLSRWKEALPYVSKELISPRVICGYILHQIPAHYAMIDIYNWKELIPDFFYLLRDIVVSYHCNNYVRFFRKLLQLPLDHCVVAAVEAIQRLRRKTLSTLCIAYKSTQMRVPISAMTQWLYYPDTCDLIALLSCCSVAQADSILVSSINLNALESEESKKLLAKL
ncbi:unnamed protein product [Strongylus vulgaris]|uniref:SAC3/GANP/THP3 conserved domain-containing protein n=1 Tax=Strongylus vulgaris TaxID=40348 RepID=A0A3P7IVI7_STRVU|nr:unnamed protein product [Strongylus vulgaris]